ncbi:DUF222 domain-containing protein [Cellulomonas sp. McL0617]|uniref:HNH endonuclease signature motif containing protein n=1 Tax=Cellulomonas sp. McL0617 TaxID=3415675 RepID=UPI003CF8C2A2
MFEDGASGESGPQRAPGDGHALADCGAARAVVLARPVPAVVQLADEVVAAARQLAAAVAPGSARLGGERARVLGRLDVLAGVIATVRGQLLIAERDSGEWRRPGVGSLEAARSAVSRSGQAAAGREVRQAETLAALPSMASAVGAGTVPVGHLDGVAGVLSRASEHVAAVLASPHGQETLVTMASEQDAPTFTRNLTRWVASLDPVAHERDHQAQRAERFLHLSDQPNGTHVRGRLDRTAGHVLRLALEAMSEVPGDDRSSEQARADALGALAARVLSLPETGSGAAVRPHVSLVLSEESWTAYRSLRGGSKAGARAGSTAGPGPSVSAGAGTDAGADTDSGVDVIPFPPATLEDGTPVPMSETLRALCDCEITRVVMNADGEPIDLGRTHRLYTGVQRRAVIARDRGCVYPGCHKPARWGEVHHVRWWDRDRGVTSVENAALLCVFHHQEVHRFDLSIERVAPPRDTAVRPRGRGGGLGPPPSYVFRLPDGTVVSGRSAGVPAGEPAPMDVDPSSPPVEPVGADPHPSLLSV